jgi:hypothetical protein
MYLREKKRERRRQKRNERRRGGGGAHSRARSSVALARRLQLLGSNSLLPGFKDGQSLGTQDDGALRSDDGQRKRSGQRGGVLRGPRILDLTA